MSQRICNIGSKEQRQRILLGAFSMALGLGFGIYCTYHDASPKLRLLLFMFFFLGSLGYFQVRSKTCVFLAYQSRSQMEGKVTPVSKKVGKQLQRQAFHVLAMSMLTAVVLTAFFVFN